MVGSNYLLSNIFNAVLMPSIRKEPLIYWVPIFLKKNNNFTRKLVDSLQVDNYNLVLIIWRQTYKHGDRTFFSVQATG